MVLPPVTVTPQCDTRFPFGVPVGGVVCLPLVSEVLQIPE